jgi:hypothetical protein
MPENCLDVHDGFARLIQHPGRQMSDGMKTRPLYLSLFAKSSQILASFFERLSVMLLAERSLCQANEHMFCILLWPFRPPPQQGLTECFGHWQPRVLPRSIPCFAGGESDLVVREIHIIPSQSPQFTFTCIHQPDGNALRGINAPFCQGCFSWQLKHAWVSYESDQRWRTGWSSFPCVQEKHRWARPSFLVIEEWSQ